MPTAATSTSGPYLDTGVTYSGTSTTSGTTINCVFRYWVTNTATTYTNAVWTTWTGTTATITGGGQVSEEQRAQWAEEQRKSKLRERVRDIIRRREQRVIRARAAALLRSILTDAEWAEWRQHDSIRVVGSDGGLYEVGCGWGGMLYRIDPQTLEPMEKLCIHPSNDYPIEDRVVTMILHLRTDEAEVLKRANRHAFADKEKGRVKVRRGHKLKLVA